MTKLGHKNSGKSSDSERLEQLEGVLHENDFGYSVTISTANLKWLVEKAGKWVRRDSGVRP
ncbi:hypothetical protein FQ087_06165 [Sporosarcina sp. ANT_H38]|uniref:hypothetical protein n=1 Tax=Sporosarcina sp. ANT_H38 TaxID=2597358 RepID=UPI0011F338FC|nr:hypothetical protein [Sporosarcina sp. ANT_H38]KAA0965849.1 hypothetical protein FQ087_06165 [Sporosarcina sp. ANT_H38]